MATIGIAIGRTKDKRKDLIVKKLTKEQTEKVIERQRKRKSPSKKTTTKEQQRMKENIVQKAFTIVSPLVSPLIGLMNKENALRIQDFAKSVDKKVFKGFLLGGATPFEVKTENIVNKSKEISSRVEAEKMFNKSNSDLAKEQLLSKQLDDFLNVSFLERLGIGNTQQEKDFRSLLSQNNALQQEILLKEQALTQLQTLKQINQTAQDNDINLPTPTGSSLLEKIGVPLAVITGGLLIYGLSKKGK